jgi:hypothetical protein
MFWFIIPVIVLILLVAIISWIVASNARRRAESEGNAGETVYGSNNQRKSPDAPPA